MSSYQQMGHHSANLLSEDNLSRYHGAILSPVNYAQDEVEDQIRNAPFGLDLIFDPQLYFPQFNREKLRNWSYFPRDVDTADRSSDAWWRNIVDELVSVCNMMGPQGVCSPTTVPRNYSDEFYSQVVAVGSMLQTSLQGENTRPLLTALANLSDLAAPNRASEIASILSRFSGESVYLIFVGRVEPRRELKDPEELKGAMKLIALLETSGMNVLVGFTSSDMVLWKAAGASSCATGKFFNLRRFTSSRFEEPSEGGGGQLPYWFEEPLLAFLRESDIPRLQRTGRLDSTTPFNPYNQEILDNVDRGGAWLGLGWRQFLYSFADLEERISNGTVDVSTLLASAEDAWLAINAQPVLMEEPLNEGGWLRPWRRALLEYPDH